VIAPSVAYENAMTWLVLSICKNRYTFMTDEGYVFTGGSVSTDTVLVAADQAQTP
jgi:hypothetical protein